MYSGYQYGRTSTNSGKVTALLEKVEQCLKQQELNYLIFLLEMCYKNFGESLLRTKLPEATKSDYLSSTIYEKVMAIKARNLDLTTKLLNMKATFSKQFPKRRQTLHESKYQQIIDGIREKSFGIREKLSRLRGYQTGKNKLVGSDNWRAREATASLKEVTELLSL